jgi:hypothetical protein
VSARLLELQPTVRARACPLCETPAGEPCQPKPAADHLARYLDAYTSGQLTREYMSRVLGELVVIDGCAVIAGSDSEPDTPAGVLEQLLAAGHTVTYVPDTVWEGYWYADLRDSRGQLLQCAGGATQAEALADLARRLDGA